jgi:hypothetical protein
MPMLESPIVVVGHFQKYIIYIKKIGIERKENACINFFTLVFIKKFCNKFYIKTCYKLVVCDNGTILSYNIIVSLSEK